MKQVLLMIAVVVLVGCGKKDDGNTGVVNPNKPSPKATSEKLITDPIVEKAIRSEFCLNKPTGELTKADLDKVTVLGLDNTKITDAGLKDIAKLQNLTNLSLYATQITDAGLKGVAKLQKLILLNLDDTKITDAGLKEVAKLQKLGWLSLCNTEITDAGVAELRKALPKCELDLRYKKD